MRRALALPCYISAALLGGCGALHARAPAEDLFSPTGSEAREEIKVPAAVLAASAEVERLEDLGGQPEDLAKARAALAEAKAKAQADGEADAKTAAEPKGVPAVALSASAEVERLEDKSGDQLADLKASARAWQELAKAKAKAEAEEEAEEEAEAESESKAQLWTYTPVNGKAITTRGEPEFDGKKTGKKLSPGDTFRVVEEKKVGETTFLKLADGEGWLFDMKPEVGLMCTKANVSATEQADAPLAQLQARAAAARAASPRTSAYLRRGASSQDAPVLQMNTVEANAQLATEVEQQQSSSETGAEQHGQKVKLSKEAREALKAERNAQRKAEREAQQKSSTGTEAEQHGQKVKLSKEAREALKAERNAQRKAEREAQQKSSTGTEAEQHGQKAKLSKEAREALKAQRNAQRKAGREAKEGPKAEEDEPKVVVENLMTEAAAAAVADGSRDWWTQESMTKFMSIPPTWRSTQSLTGGRPSDERPEKEVTAIVTHAGKNSQEFIDMAVMLAVSLKRHAPDYPRFAIAVRGMTEANQKILAKAGWTVVMVDDWSEFNKRQMEKNSPEVSLRSDVGGQFLQVGQLSGAGEALGLQAALNGSGDADSVHGERFFWRWGDAFEKLNMFRFPFGRVLYLDADTYVMSDQVGFLLNATDVAEGHIGMVHDGCRNSSAEDGEYNSGVMLFRPDRGMFTKLLDHVGGVMSGRLAEKPDQPIINEVYRGRVTALDRKYNCIDRTGRTATVECAQNCKEVVVTHFTGMPKPATADAKFLDIVRRPYSPIQHCFNTNHGSCKAWAGYYCDMVENKQSLTQHLGHVVEATGKCCHSPPKKGDPAECSDGCPSQLEVSGWMVVNGVRGIFNRTNLPSHPVLNAGRPIYVGRKRTPPFADPGDDGNTYIWYLKPYGNWVIGWNYKGTMAWAYSHERASCPSDTKRWKQVIGRQYVSTKVSIVPDSPVQGMTLDLRIGGTGEWIQ